MTNIKTELEYEEGDTLAIVPRLIGSQTSRIKGILNRERLGCWTITPEGTSVSIDFDWNDWVIDSIEKAAPKNVLPTEAGTVISGRVAHPVDGLPSHFAHQLMLHADTWRSPGGTRCDKAAISNWVIVSEPPSMTAKKVIAEVRGIFGGPGALLHKDVDKIAARFGVSS